MTPGWLAKIRGAIFWRFLGETHRIGVVDRLLRNRAGMLHHRGMPMVGLSMFRGVVPSDAEFEARARAVVETTGRRFGHVLRELDRFEEELAHRLDEGFERATEAARREQRTEGDPEAG